MLENFSQTAVNSITNILAMTQCRQMKLRHFMQNLLNNQICDDTPFRISLISADKSWPSTGVTPADDSSTPADRRL